MGMMGVFPHTPRRGVGAEPGEVGTGIVPYAQMKKLRHREPPCCVELGSQP